MSKTRKRRNVETATVELPATELPEPEWAVVTPDEMSTDMELGRDPRPTETRFTVGTWAGRPQWTCVRCRYDTLKGEADILAHWQEKHEPRPEPKPEPRVQVYSASGRPINA